MTCDEQADYHYPAPLHCLYIYVRVSRSFDMLSLPTMHCAWHGALALTGRTALIGNTHALTGPLAVVKIRRYNARTAFPTDTWLIPCAVGPTRASLSEPDQVASGWLPTIRGVLALALLVWLVPCVVHTLINVYLVRSQHRRVAHSRSRRSAKLWQKMER